MSNWWMENFVSGYGCDRILDSNSVRQNRSFWDGKVDTERAGQITNPRKRYTENNSLTPKYYFNRGGTLYGYRNTGTITVIRRTSTGNWVSQATQDVNTGGSKIFDVAGMPCVAVNDNVGDANIYSLGDAIVGDEEFAEVGNPEIACYLPINQIFAIKDTNDELWLAAKGDATGYQSVGTHTRPNLANMKAFVGQDGYEGLFLFYKDRVTCVEDVGGYGTLIDVDMAEVPYINLEGCEDDNNASEVVAYNKQLIFPVQDTLLAYAANGIITDIGMNMFSGMPSAKQGKVINLQSSVRNLFAGVYQSGVTQVYIFNGEGWHWFGQSANIGTSGHILLTKGSDDTSRLLAGGNLDPTLSLWKHPFENPIHPAEGIAFNFESGGDFITPEYDGGLPNQVGVALKLHVEGTFDVNRKATLYYSTLGAGGNFTALGQATQKGLNTFDFGTVGIEHSLIQFKADLDGNATQSPVIRTMVFDYLKTPDNRNTYTFTIDLVKTAGGSQSIHLVAGLIASLNTVRDSKVLVPFQYGAFATSNVKMLAMPAKEEHVTGTDNVYGTTGLAALVTLRLGEFI